MQVHEITYAVPTEVQDPSEVAKGVTETVTVSILAPTYEVAKRKARDWVLRDLDLDQTVTKLIIVPHHNTVESRFDAGEVEWVDDMLVVTV